MIDKLEMFIALANERHFGRAAEAVGVTQPSLSSAIKQLEDQLGVQLVFRGARFQGLTPEGQRVLDWALRIVGDTRTMREEMKAIRSGVFSTHRGHSFSGEDQLRGRIIEALMCDFRVMRSELLAGFDTTPDRIETLFQSAAAAFGDMVRVTDEGFFIPERARPLTRMIARAFDAYDSAKAKHSAAI